MSNKGRLVRLQDSETTRRTHRVVPEDASHGLRVGCAIEGVPLMGRSFLRYSVILRSAMSKYSMRCNSEKLSNADVM